MNNPKISVILPAYNAEEYIEEAIQSILDQTYTNFELIVINDCSKDKTWKIIKELANKDERIVALNNEKNLKLSKTLNKGIKEAKGEYIARMDADDISIKDRFQKQVEVLDQNPEIGIVGGTMEIMDHEGNKISMRSYPSTDKEIREKIFRYSPFCHPAIMIRKSALDKSGNYNHEYNPAEDYELYFRIGKYAKFANLPDTLLRYRILPNSMTTGGTKNMELKTLEIRKEYNKHSEYTMNFIDKAYTLLHHITIYIFPPKLKIWLFNLLRNSK